MNKITTSTLSQRKIKYGFKKGARVPKAARKKSQEVGEEMERIRDVNGGFFNIVDGRITGNHVVDEAKDPNSVLHPFFTWDIQEAAKKCWNTEAHNLIQVVVVEPDPDDSDFPRVNEIRAFTNVRNQGPSEQYENTLHVLSDPEKRKEALAQAYRQLQWFVERNRYLDELDQLFSLIESLGKTLDLGN